MRKNILRILSAAAAAAFLCSCGSSGEEEGTQEVAQEVYPLGFNPTKYIHESSQVRSGESFTTLMGRLGLSGTRAYELSTVCDTVFDARRIIAGKNIDAYYSGDSLARQLEYVVYSHNKVKSTVFACADSLQVWNYSRPLEHERKYADVTINSSLWNDMIAAGASPELIVELADIYQWSVNFFGLQKGDRFRMIYDQSVCEGEVMAIDSVEFCLYTGGGLSVPAVRYGIDGKKNLYWGKGGESLKKMFLKAPLKYNRISSGFSYHRKHPVTGKVRAHTAVDYAAPTGTPVHAIGDGTVTLCGWDGSGGGNRIKIKHIQGYESCYMHLSKFAPGIKAGSRVSQGQLIGYVGSTGRSTGPHLDFRIWQNGKPLNPLKLNSPASDPLPAKYLEEFEKVYEKYMAEVDSIY